ncbi:hypothetical protein DLM78_18720 [Leptospira stimsonii]|uniref:Uncharacterized protein n=1 Tax=Leptospira stimsonii TaxID=2202203 RepID=A0A8B3CL28_9LEPT|nr:hypothetical protein DLM78_18720 [Leptospira stimsonii]
MYSIGAEHRSRVAKKFWNFLKKGSEIVPKIDFRGKKEVFFETQNADFSWKGKSRREFPTFLNKRFDGN